MATRSKFTRWLFGDTPEIFDEEGHVDHHLKPDIWKSWDKRYHASDYDWRKQTPFMPPQKKSQSPNDKRTPSR